jgi:hypothetical protein
MSGHTPWKKIKRKVTIAIPQAMYERFAHERRVYGVKTVREVIERKLHFWEGRWQDNDE